MGSPVQIRREWIKCKRSVGYFVSTYCKIYDAKQADWIPFLLWPEQREVLDIIDNNRLVVILKARQLGLTWLCLCYILWRMLFHPIFTSLVFSRRETEAGQLLSDNRLRGIYRRLPDWAKTKKILVDSSLVWQLSNDSVCYAFPTTAGDSYTAGLAFVDEADLVPNLGELMTAVKPTIDGGGKMILLSRSDKDVPNSTFKNIYRGAKKGGSGWISIFLPWQVRPDRDQAWYEEQKRDTWARTQSYDDLWEQYPATDEEALRVATIGKRFRVSWLDNCYVEQAPLEDTDFYIPFLRVYKEPEQDHEYVIGGDPAEGNPESDDSVLTVLDVDTLEECAIVAGKIEPTDFALYAMQLGKYYNGARCLPERNNHGHAVILALRDIHEQDVLRGWDYKHGWLSTRRGKATMFTYAADALRDKQTIVHDPDTYAQMMSIGGATLKAPEGENDDFAISWSLAVCAARMYGAVAEYGDNPTHDYRG